MTLAKPKNRNDRSGSRSSWLRNGSSIGLIATLATGCSLRSVDYLGNGLGGMAGRVGGGGAISATQDPGGGNAMLLGSAGAALGTNEVAGTVGNVPGLAGMAGASPSGGTAGVGARTSFAGGVGNGAMAGRLGLGGTAGADAGAGRPSSASAGLGGMAPLGGTSNSMAGNPGTVAPGGMPSGGVGTSVARGGASASPANGGRTASSGGTTSPNGGSTASPNGGSTAGQGAAGDFGNGPPSLALDKPASASSVQDSTSKGSNLAPNGNDSSMTTRWCASSESVPQWWQVDLQQIRQLTGTRVIWEFSGRIYGYYIEVSNDAATWVEVVDKRNTTSTDQAQSDSFGAQARYVRITITSVSTNPTTWASFNDFAVYGQ